MQTRASDERGFGLIELLMALTMLNIGILAIVAAFNSGIFALNRSSRLSTATSLADAQMELYRGLKYTSIFLDTTSLGTTDNIYKCDSTLGGSCPNATSGEVQAACGTVTNACNPSRSAIGADRKNYRVDTYITFYTPTNGRVEKLVTVVVRDAKRLSARLLVREASTFDQSTGT